MTKGEIRKLVLNQRNELSLSMKEVEDTLLYHRLIEQKDYQQCDIVLCYRSFQSEINTWNIIEQSWKDGKKVYLPRVEGKQIEFYEIHPTTNFLPSKYGILEPPVGIPFLSEETEKVLMVLPGVAFDIKGNRIGYGAGYYDRYLISHPMNNLKKISLAYDLQIFNQLGDLEDHDQKVDIIITPSTIFDRSMQ